jgi:serine/threonine protein kinase
MLKKMKEVGDPNKHHFIELIDYFYYNEQTYIITERLGKSLYEQYIKVKIRPSLSNLQSITRQILQSLQFMKNNKIIHADLKPENILLDLNN